MGGGGGGYIPPSSDRLRQRIEVEREKEHARLDKDIGRFLQDLLTRFNDRDVEATREKIESLKETLGEHSEIEQFLFGGSVAKHTYVDGLSDIDALVILDRTDLQGKSPKAVLHAFYRQLDKSLPSDSVAGVTKGNMAVTISYRDGTELQILPALKSGNQISITDATGNAWKATRPHAARQQLTQSNKKLNGALVPAIKLFKSAVAHLPQQQQLTGYHVETLVLDAAQTFKGPKTPRAVLMHSLERASKRVLQPMQDITGQNRTVDSYLGQASSNERRNVSLALGSVKRRLDAATSVGQWKALFEE